MLTEALPRWLLAEIKDRETGLNTVSIHDIFDHGFDRYGQIHDDLVDKYTSMYNAPIDMSKDADQPITDAQLAEKGQLHVGQTGSFCEKYLQWKCRDIALKTWTEFKTFWNHGANAALQTNPNIHELEKVMDNLAFAATTSNNVLGQLTENNAKLTAQLGDVMKVIKQLQDENKKLLKIIELSVISGTGMGG
eukprot:1164339-Ditylum_brightwellii.AAC.1